MSIVSWIIQMLAAAVVFYNLETEPFSASWFAVLIALLVFGTCNYYDGRVFE